MQFSSRDQGNAYGETQRHFIISVRLFIVIGETAVVRVDCRGMVFYFLVLLDVLSKNEFDLMAVLCFLC